jgi:hypothetical protein
MPPVKKRKKKASAAKGFTHTEVKAITSKLSPAQRKRLKSFW